MKRFFALLSISIIAVGGLVGCNTDDSTKNSNTGKTLQIGIVQIVDHTSLNEIRESFIDELQSLGIDATIDYKDAQNNMSNLSSICQTFVGDGKDLIVAISTPAAQTALNAAEGSNIPVLFSAVTDPVDAGLVSNLEKPDKNATGTSDAIDVEKIFELAKTLTPDAKTFGLLYNSGESNSASVIENVKTYAEQNDLSVVDKSVTNVSEIQKAVESMVGNVDAIFSPIDNTVANAMPSVAQLTREQKLPVYVAADSMVKDGGFATVGINYTTLGKETAKIAKEIIKGKAIADIPVVTLNELDTVINTTTANEIGVEIPSSILDKAITFQ